MGDFNTDINSPNTGRDKLDEFCTLFALTNLITSEICIAKTHWSTIDLILTNKPNSFQKSATTETGFSDFEKSISNYFKAYFLKKLQKL